MRSSLLFCSSFKSVIESIKEQVTLSDIIGHYVDVKPLGASSSRQFTSLCPFHDDKNPSLRISDSKGLYYCFSCNNGGDVIKFVQEIEKISYQETMLKIVSLSGLNISLSQPKLSDPKNAYDMKRERLQEILLRASDFYVAKLSSPQSGGQARSYLKSRKLSAKSAYQFQIGFAPYNANNFEDSLVYNLTCQGFKLDELVAAGLILANSNETLTRLSELFTKYNNSSSPIHSCFSDKNFQSLIKDVHDRFHNRLMIPIRDYRGIIIGFGGRLLETNSLTANSKFTKYPKYLNSPETIVFKKGYSLFGIDLAKIALQSSTSSEFSPYGIVLVEGYFDVMTLHDCGVKNVVGVLGTAISKEQVIIIDICC